MIKFSDFEKKIKVIFNDKNLLKQAFIHRSYINENPLSSLAHNERLEFLGDAVLELIVTDFLYKKYPQHTEGELTALRSALVNAIIISEIASAAGMNDYLLLSKGEAKDNGKARQYILANGKIRGPDPPARNGRDSEQETLARREIFGAGKSAGVRICNAGLQGPL